LSGFNPTPSFVQARLERILHFAPETMFVRRLSTVQRLEYLTADLVDTMQWSGSISPTCRSRQRHFEVRRYGLDLMGHQEESGFSVTTNFPKDLARVPARHAS
jgi:hypothetical protein